MNRFALMLAAAFATASFASSAGAVKRAEAPKSAPAGNAKGSNPSAAGFSNGKGSNTPAAGFANGIGSSPPKGYKVGQPTSGSPTLASPAHHRVAAPTTSSPSISDAKAALEAIEVQKSKK